MTDREWQRSTTTLFKNDTDQLWIASYNDNDICFGTLSGPKEFLGNKFPSTRTMWEEVEEGGQKMSALFKLSTTSPFTQEYQPIRQWWQLPRRKKFIQCQVEKWIDTNWRVWRER